MHPGRFRTCLASGLRHLLGVPAEEACLAPQPPSALPLILILLPVLLLFSQTPMMAAVSFLACAVLSFHYRCHKAFLITVAGAFLLNLLIYSGATVHWDIDAYIVPQIRLMASGFTLQPDGGVSEAHLSLPGGFSAWCAALYRLTGSVDCGGMLIFLLIVAAWVELRRSLPKLQTAILVIAPPLFPSLWNLMSDGSVYLLLLTALFALRRKAFWLPLAAASLAVTFKTSAWIPAALLFLVLLRDHPRRFWILGLAGGFALLCVFPSLRLLFSSTGQTEISCDFATRANADALSMGYWARQAYAYLGHWTTSLSPDFGVHTGGVDGGGIDGFGPLFRAAVWSSLAVLLFCRKRLTGWGETLLLAWGATLLIPTLYIGYARYVPFLYPAVMLPLIRIAPRPAALLNAALCVMPALWLGWRAVLSTEYIAVSARAEAIHSGMYNLRCDFREKLAPDPQPVHSGSLVYTYRPGADFDFPAIPRKPEPRLFTVSPARKIDSMRVYALREWIPWFATHFDTYLFQLASLRWHRLLEAKGVNDGIPSTDPR